MNTSKKMDRIIAAVLSVVFLGFLFTAFFAMMINDGKSIINSTRIMKSLATYLPEDWDSLDLLQARISSFTATIADKMWLKDEMGYLNSEFQYGLGKQLITTGNQNMLTLTTGHLHDILPYTDMQGAIDEVLKLQASTPKDTYFMFSYEHPTVYEQSMIPAGYEVLDHTNELADEVVNSLRTEGVDVLDSRDVLKASGHSWDELLMATDQHWATLSALVMAQSIAEQINEELDANLDTSLLDMDQMNTFVHENLFMGKYGQRIGTGLIDPDDIVEFWPTYETNISRHSLRADKFEDVSGEFRDVAIRTDRLKMLPGKTWNIRAYTYYGQVEPYEIYTNESAPDFTIMVFKDSYSAPMLPFLSLMARNVIGVDFRHEICGAPEEWIEKYQPDVLVASYSLQFLRNDKYDFVGLF